MMLMVMVMMRMLVLMLGTGRAAPVRCIEPPNRHKGALHGARYTPLFGKTGNGQRSPERHKTKGAPPRARSTHNGCLVMLLLLLFMMMMMDDDGC